MPLKGTTVPQKERSPHLNTVARHLKGLLWRHTKGRIAFAILTFCIFFGLLVSFFARSFSLDLDTAFLSGDGQ